MLKSKVLVILEQNKNKIVTGGELAKRLGVSRTAVWKAVGALQKDGYEIEPLKNTGYRFIDGHDVLSEELIRKNMNTKFFGSRIEILKTVDSTNSYLKGLNLSALQEGFVVIADEQTKGRGRMGRSFCSPSKQGIYMSLLLKPDISAENIQFFTICAAVAVCRAIEKICGIDVKIKWVNDILYDNKKLCGILTEAAISAEMQRVEHVVVGIGVNTGAVPAEVEDIAASIYRITGKAGYRNILIAEILNQFEELYIKHDQKPFVLDEYIRGLYILNKKVSVSDFKTSFEATAIGVGKHGELILKDSQNKIIYLKSGEIKLL